MPNGVANNKPFSKHNHPIDRLTEFAALLSGISLFPQAFKIYSTKTVTDIAPSTYFIVLVSNTIWIAYGIHRRSIPLLISGFLNLMATILILAMYFAFRV